MCGCSIVVDKSRNLIFLREMGIGEAQVSDKNRGVPSQRSGSSAMTMPCFWVTDRTYTYIRGRTPKSQLPPQTM